MPPETVARRLPSPGSREPTMKPAPAPPRAEPDRLAALARLRRLAQLLDARFELPGTRFRFGFDALIGLVPGVGDLAGGALTLWLILEARRLGARRRTLAKMAGNALLDVVVGAVPLAGDLFDATFKANLRNVRLLERDLGRGAPRA